MKDENGEFKIMKWNTEKTKIKNLHHHCNSIPTMEQECHFNCNRCENKIWVCCSDQTWITKLKKCKHFVVTDILISPDVSNLQINDDMKILQVTGYLPSNALSLRLKIANSCDSEENSEVQE